MSIKENIFNYILHKQPQRQVVMPQMEQVRYIAVLHDADDIAHIVKQLSIYRARIDTFTQPDKKHTNRLLSRPSKEVIRAITTQQYDLLIDLTQQPNLLSYYMAMYIHANFKVGRHTREGIYDLTIDTPPQPTPDFLYQQSIKYINMLTKDKNL